MRLGGVKLAVLLTIPFVACAELRVAENVPDPDRDSTDEEWAEDASERGDARKVADVHVPDASDDAADPEPGCDGPCPPEQIAKGLTQATAITVDAQNIYFAVETDNGTVYQCPKTGCKAAPIELGSGYAMSIVVADKTVYWGDFTAGKLQACAVGGCNKAPTAIVSNQPYIHGAFTDGVDLFWETNGEIRRCKQTTCSTANAATITTGQLGVTHLAADQGKVIWPHSSTVYACPAGPCASPTALGPGSAYVSVHAGKAYWVNAKTIVSCSINGCNKTPFTIGASAQPAHPVSDGKHVYWRDMSLDEIYRCPVAGCGSGPEVLATNQRGQPSGQIALDGEYVYWTTTTSVYRLRK